SHVILTLTLSLAGTKHQRNKTRMDGIKHQGEDKAAKLPHEKTAKVSSK
ncbi:MAG: hypothetical protein RIR73_2724, partial [Chloroflexota bacterium]